MATFEYTTVALPELVRGRTKRKQTRGEMIAANVAEAINAQAQEGWEYVGCDHFNTVESAGIFKRPAECTYSVLIFRKRIGGEPQRSQPQPRPIQQSAPMQAPHVQNPNQVKPVANPQAPSNTAPQVAKLGPADSK